jgi:hypothetical protein
MDKGPAFGLSPMRVSQSVVLRGIPAGSAAGFGVIPEGESGLA